MKRLCILAATVAMIFSGNVADAQQRGEKGKNASSQSDGQSREQRKSGRQKGEGLFRLLDLNRDGNLSAKEIDGAVAALMKLDVNKDGLLDAKELVVSGGGGIGLRGQRGGQGSGKGGKNKGSLNKSAKNGN